MSSHGYPDWQRFAVWLGAPIVQATALAIGAGAHVDGPFQVSNYASVILAIKPTGGSITATIKQTVPGGPAGLILSEQVVVPAGATLFEAFVLLGGQVELDLQGTAGGETVDYALYPSNTTTNAQVITAATLNIQHNAVLVAAEQTLDFEDAAGAVWTVVDDGPNTRVKVTPAKNAGAELGYAQVTANVTINGGAIAIVALGSITFDGSPVLFEFYCAAISIPSDASEVIINLYEDGVVVCALTKGALEAAAAGNMEAPAGTFRLRRTPAAGAHTYAVKGTIGGVVNATVLAGTGTGGNTAPASLCATVVV